MYSAHFDDAHHRSTRSFAVAGLKAVGFLDHRSKPSFYTAGPSEAAAAANVLHAAGPLLVASLVLEAL
jgi:hypothetical protein